VATVYPSTLLDVRTEGAVGDGTTDNTTAFTDAINKAVSMATSTATRVVVYVPSGTYAISGDLPAITVDNIWIVGDSADTSILLGSAGQKMLTWGAVGAPVYTGGIRSIGFRYANTPPGGACCISVVSGVIFISDISLLHVGTFITFGAHQTDTGGGAFMESIRGYTYYGGSSTEGYPLINVLSGGGIWIYDWSVTVGGGGTAGASPTYPGEVSTDPPDAYSTEYMIVGDGLRGARTTDYQLPGNSGADAGGINFLQIIPAGTSVDTIYMSNVLTQFFTCGIYAYCDGSAGSCAIDFIVAINTTFDNSGQDGVYFGGDDSGSWSVNDCLFSNCIACGWDRYGFAFTESELGRGYLQNIRSYSA